MNISKSMFKNLTRCPDFASIYDMYIFRNAHHVKMIDGIDVSKIQENVNQLEEGLFLEENEKAMEIFSSMFDEETGEDLTISVSAQMQAYAEYFTKLEVFANKYIRNKYQGTVTYSEITKEQKKYEFTSNDNTYYCYLDIFLDASDGSKKIFEVKATTTNKFYKLGKENKKNIDKDGLSSSRYDSIFVKDEDGILRLKELIDPSILEDKDYLKQREKMFNRYGSGGTGKYVYDLAVERYIVENSEVNTSNFEYYLVVLNGDYIYDGYREDDECVYRTNDNGNDLITIIDMNKITEEWQPRIEIEKVKLEECLQERLIKGHCTGEQCELKKSTECKFKKVCFANTLCNGSILEYMNKTYAFGGKGTLEDKMSVYELINQGCYTIDSIPRDNLGKLSNQIQYDCYVNKSTYVNKDKITRAINSLQYPLYHLDFESYGCPFPRYRGEVPYTQSLFQYSLHIEKKPYECDKEKNHYEFLAKDHSDCRRALCESMIKNIDLSKGGMVIVYNENFEKTRLKELAKIYPDLSNDLLNIREHVFDLLLILKGSSKMFYPLLPADMDKKEREEKAKEINYYDNDLHGSFSIKKVLPIFSNLSYKDLDVHNGTEAVLVYGMLPTLTEQEYQNKYLALEKYCQQDTWAMVEILWGLRKKYTN